MNPKWIRLKSAVGEHKAGATIEVDEAVARGYVAAGLAEEAEPVIEIDEATRNEIRAVGRELAATVAREMRAGAGEAARRPGVAAGSGVDFDSIEDGDEADRRSAGDWLRNVVVALGSPDQDVRVAAHNRLTAKWRKGGYGVRRGMTESGGASGGYTTPTLYENAIYKVAAETGVIVPGATVKPLGARTVEWPALNQYSAPAAGQSAFFGGVTVSRKGETSQRTASAPTFSKVFMSAIDLTAYTEISRDLVMDSAVNIDGEVTDLMGQAIGWREDWEAINGTGSGQFLGYLNAPATILLARNTSAHVKYQDIFSMYVRLYSQGKKNAVWVCHPYTTAELLQIQDPSGRFIMIPWMPAGDATPLGSASPMAGYKMLGIPVLETEKAPVLGSTGDLTLIDRSAYYVGRRSGLEIGLSEHFKFDTDQLAIRAKLRNDGQPAMKKAITLADGSNTVSFAVVLQ